VGACHYVLDSSKALVFCGSLHVGDEMSWWTSSELIKWLLVAFSRLIIFSSLWVGCGIHDLREVRCRKFYVRMRPFREYSTHERSNLSVWMLKISGENLQEAVFRFGCWRWATRIFSGSQKIPPVFHPAVDPFDVLSTLLPGSRKWCPLKCSLNTYLVYRRR